MMMMTNAQLQEAFNNLNQDLMDGKVLKRYELNASIELIIDVFEYVIGLFLNKTVIQFNAYQGDSLHRRRTACKFKK